MHCSLYENTMSGFKTCERLFSRDDSGERMPWLTSKLSYIQCSNPSAVESVKGKAFSLHFSSFWITPFLKVENKCRSSSINHGHSPLADVQVSQ